MWQILRHGIVGEFDSHSADGGRAGTPSNTLTKCSPLSTLGEKVVTDVQGSTMGRCPAFDRLAESGLMHSLGKAAGVTAP